jgi:hypothetical protein
LLTAQQELIRLAELAQFEMREPRVPQRSGVRRVDAQNVQVLDDCFVIVLVGEVAVSAREVLRFAGLWGAPTRG